MKKKEQVVDQAEEIKLNEEVSTEESVDDIKNEAMAELEKQIISLEEENKKLVDQVKRTQAELINYRTRKDKEVSDMLKYANQGIITDLVPVIDNFERAVGTDNSNLTDEMNKFLTGFKMIYSSLSSVLKNYGVEEISRKGEIFDPSLEQALLTDKVDELDDEVVLEVLQKGYKLHDRVVRAASVKVNQK